MAVKPLPPASLLRQLLRYEPDTGRLFLLPRDASHYPVPKKQTPEHRANFFNAVYAGNEVTFRRGWKHRGVKLMDVDYHAHRIIWKMVTGEEPDMIDHINGDGFDNRWCNLRNVNRLINNQNRRLHRTNTTGTAGVKLHSSGKWQARYAQKHLGTFETKKEAIEARKAYEATIPEMVSRPQSLLPKL